MLGKGTTIACAPCLDPNRLWDSACGFIYVGVSIRNIKFLAAAVALLFALSANVAPAMASSHDKDKSGKYEQQDKNKTDKKDNKKKKHGNKNKQDD